ncbi:MAG: divergent polysaccharide deacetylase family protein [Candidatus Delongbacteria bacterium]|nr:divergent polysaccharide deacetylase family protein [Candidatus Delongbacteria bacterium]MBN2834647.1 divergent polysaccharide deacetylase family protein [Candidatus Delongbacteria bacterium]
MNTVLFLIPDNKVDIKKESMNNSFLRTLDEKHADLKKQTEERVFKDVFDSLIFYSRIPKEYVKRYVSKSKIVYEIKLPNNNSLTNYNLYLARLIRPLSPDFYFVTNEKGYTEAELKIRGKEFKVMYKVDKNLKEPLLLESRIAIVIDDFGYQNPEIDYIKGFVKFPVSLTMAVIPGHSFSNEISKQIRKNDKELIIHFPMEAKIGSISSELIKLKEGMDSSEVKSMLFRAFVEVPGASGLNNHMGSKATENSDLMKIFFNQYKKYNRYFFDSFTTADSKCRTICEEFGIKYLKRDVFIDNQEDKESIIQSFQFAVEKLKEGSDVIVIGHARSETYETLMDIVMYKYPELNYVKLGELLN